MENYSKFIELLKTFNKEDRAGEIAEEYSSSIFYNGFPCENLDDISTYKSHLEVLYSKAFSDVKKGIDKLMIERDNAHMLNIFFKGKLDDFKEVQEIVDQRDADNTKQKIKYESAASYGEYNGVSLGADGIEMYNQFRDAVRGEELYYRDSIDKEGLLEYCLPEAKIYKSNAMIFFILAEKEQRDMVKKAKKKLEELYALYCPQIGENEKKIEKVFSKYEKDFRSYLHHDNKDALIEKLHELIDGEKGRVVAITIKALEKLGFIAVLSNRSALYKSMEKEFGDIGAYQGLNKFYNDLSAKELETEAYLKTLKAQLQHQVDILSQVK